MYLEPCQTSMMEVFTKTVTLHKICKNTGFHRPAFFCIRTESTILSLYGRIRASENPYSRIFYAVITTKKLSNINIHHRSQRYQISVKKVFLTILQNASEKRQENAIRKRQCKSLFSRGLGTGV